MLDGERHVGVGDVHISGGGTVGLMLLPLLDADVDSARTPAIALGKAIQLINILRDVAPDATLGRVYLPQDMLALEGVQNEDILRL